MELNKLIVSTRKNKNLNECDNRSIRKFLSNKIVHKLAKDFCVYNSWESMGILSEWATLARKRMVDDGVDAKRAMKRVLRRDDIIKQWVIERIEDMEKTLKNN